MNTFEAQNSLRQSATIAEFRYYNIMGGGRNKYLIENLFIERIIISKDIFEYISRGAVKRCKNPTNDDERYYCKYISDLKFGHCNVDAYDAVKQKRTYIKRIGKHSFPVNYEVALLLNTVYDECAYKTFIAYSFQFDMAGFTLSPKSIGTFPKQPPKAKDDKPVEQPTLSDQDKVGYRFSFPDTKLDAKLEKVAAEEKDGKIGLEIVFRSPESMVRYLGNLIQLQIYRVYVPSVYIGKGREAELFIVEKGNVASPAAVRALDTDGEIYSIPAADYSKPDHHLSMQIMSLVVDILNGAVSQKSLPQVTTLTLNAVQ